VNRQYQTSGFGNLARIDRVLNPSGSEYDRAVFEHGSSHKAEAKLAGRETRVEALRIRELGATALESWYACAKHRAVWLSR
jgi:hypothetical protein